MNKDILNFKVLFVVGIFFLIIAFDKLVYIGFIQECCTINGRQSNIFAETINNEFNQDRAVNLAREQNKKILLNLGSSRSLGFYKSPTNSQIDNTPYLSSSSRIALKEWEILPSAYPGASSLISLVRLRQWIDHGLAPNKIAVEISPFALSENNQWFRHELLNAIPPSYFLQHPQDISWKHLRKLIGSRIFALSRFKLGKPVNSKSDWDLMFEKVKETNSSQKIDPPIEGGIKYGEEAVTDKLVYDFVIKEITRTTLNNFVFSEDLKAYVLKMADVCLENKIDVVFWIPKNHPDLNLAMNKHIPSNEWKSLLNEIQSKGIKVVDLNDQEKMKCDYFSDPFHQDVRCFPEIGNILIEN